MRTSSIPVLLLTGFLGAGKTSLLNYILSNNQDLKIGVIVNDFGAINVDARLVSAQTDTALELSNGCICCSLEDGADLDDALSQLAHKGSRLNYIIVEASGLADVRELATILRVQKNDYCHFDSLVNIVDAANFKRNNEANPEAIKDLEIADIIIVNKTDLIKPEELKDIMDGLKLAAGKARLLSSRHGKVALPLLLNIDTDKPSSQFTLEAAHNHDYLAHDHDHSEHVHSHFKSIVFETDKPLDPQDFEKWAENLDPEIFRMKGFVFFGMKGAGQKFLFQSVGQRWSLKLDEWGLQQEPTSELVIIGRNFSEKKILKEMEKLIDTQPDNVSAETLMDIFDYR